MEQKVQEYLEKKRQKEQAQREQHLISLGLYEKEYSPDGGYSQSYPELDEDKRYYRRVALQATAEEYAEICSYDGSYQGESNLVGIRSCIHMLETAAWIVYIGGGIVALLLTMGIDSPFLMVLGSQLIMPFTGGTILLALSKILYLQWEKSKRQA